MQNRHLFQRDPTTFSIPNDGVTTVTAPSTPEQWNVLRYELQTFVCEGEYRVGLERILSTYLAQLGQSKQPAVWVSGFYGSGKSHLVRVLEHTWRNLTLDDGTEARHLSSLPDSVKELLRELTTAGKQRGGLWAAAGRLSGGADSIRLDMLRIVLESAGLPVEYAPARFVLWLKRKGIYEAVRDAVEREGVTLTTELRDMYVSPLLAGSLLTAMPDFADNQKQAREFLKAQFPGKAEISNAELVETVRMVLELQSNKPGALPCALLIFDEMQQAIGEDTDRALEVQAIVEDLCSAFGSNLLVVGTGQSAIQATSQLQKLQGRFNVRVELSDRDVEHVVREVILRKDPTTTPQLKTVLDNSSGEIDRHLAGTKIAPSSADQPALIPDYPLLPSRRRFWERVLRAIDTGTAAQLRTQLRMVHEASRAVAEQPVGTVVGGDFIYGQQKPAMLQSGVLLNDLAAIIEQQNDGTAEGALRARLCATIFLIGRLPASGAAATGLRADATTLADLLVEDLPQGSAGLRQQVAQLLEELAGQGVLMSVEGEYRLQTRESAEWQSDFNRRFGAIRNDATRIAGDRSAALRLAVDKALKGVKLIQGVNKTPRKFELHFGQEAPPANTTAVPVWVRDEWSVTDKTVREEAQAAGVESPTVFVLLPRQQSQPLTDALAGVAAATATLDARPAQQTTPEGMEARQAMETRHAIEARKVDEIVQGILSDARVYQGGGNEVVGATLAEAVQSAADNALVRLFAEFGTVDAPGWHLVVSRAGQGNAGALEAVKHSGDPADYPAAKQILARISASGTKGSDLRTHFTGAGYGWPQDAVDGILLTLLNAGLVSARDKGGQPVSARQIPQSQIGVTTFYRESFILTTGQKIGLRKLIQDVGLTAKPDQEAAGIHSALQRLRDLAADVTGPEPLPLPPDTAAIEALQALAGNEQLVRVYEAREALLAGYQQWQTLVDRKEERLKRWRLLNELLQQARDLPVAQEVGPQVAAIRQQRSLLEELDPVKPLLEKVSAALREAAQKARQAVEEARQRELKAIEATDEWAQLPDEEWKDIFQGHHLGPIDQPDIGTDEKLLAAMNAKPLAAWGMELEAIPGRIDRTREEAARRIAPKAVRVRPPSTTLRTVEEAEAYVAALREEILAHIQDGKPVLI